MVDVPPGRSISKEPVTLCPSYVSYFPRVLCILILDDLCKKHKNDVFENLVWMSAFKILNQWAELLLVFIQTWSWCRTNVTSAVCKELVKLYEQWSNSELKILLNHCFASFCQHLRCWQKIMLMFQSWGKKNHTAFLWCQRKKEASLKWRSALRL